MQAIEIHHPCSSDLAPYIGRSARYSYLDEPGATPSHYGTIIRNSEEECVYTKNSTYTYSGLIDTIQILL